jgi:hypothetical protein
VGVVGVGCRFDNVDTGDETFVDNGGGGQEEGGATRPGILGGNCRLEPG